MQMGTKASEFEEGALSLGLFIPIPFCTNITTIVGLDIIRHMERYSKVDHTSFWVPTLLTWNWVELWNDDVIPVGFLYKESQRVLKGSYKLGKWDLKW